MSNPLVIASFEARSAGLRVARAELLLLAETVIIEPASGAGSAVM